MKRAMILAALLAPITADAFCGVDVAGSGDKPPQWHR